MVIFYSVVPKLEIIMYDELRDLVPFEWFKNHEKQPWKGVTFSKVAG